MGKKREDLTDRSELSELFVSINTPECIHMDLEIFPTPLCRTVPAWRGYVFVVAVVLWVFLFVCLIVWTDGHQPSSHCMDFQLDLSQCFTRPIQNIQNTFFLASHSMLALALCLRSLSCWNMKFQPIFKCTFPRSSLYLTPSILPHYASPTMLHIQDGVWVDFGVGPCLYSWHKSSTLV